MKWLRARSATADGLESDTTTADVMSRARVLDIGTGTGAIALSVAHETGCTVIATDLSRDALSLAFENRAACGLAERVELRHGATWEPIVPGEVFDVVVSNPPYIDEADRGTLAPEVVAWEPGAALFAPGAGLAVLSAIIEGAPGHLRAGGLLALEIGASQGAAVNAAVAARGSYGAPRVLKDLAGRDRMVLAETLHDNH